MEIDLEKRGTHIGFVSTSKRPSISPLKVSLGIDLLCFLCRRVRSVPKRPSISPWNQVNPDPAIDGCYSFVFFFRCKNDNGHQSYALYDEAFQQHLKSPNTLTLAAYLELHNNYVQDVHAANAMVDQYHNTILPQLVQVTLSRLFSIRRSPIGSPLLQPSLSLEPRLLNQNVAGSMASLFWQSDFNQTDYLKFG